MRNIYTTSIFRTTLTLLFIAVIFPGNLAAQWNIYDASVLPDKTVPVFGTSGLAGSGMGSTIIADPGNPENKFLELLTVAAADNGTWRRVYPVPVTNVTIVMRVKSANDNGLRVLELDIDNGGFRERLYINQQDNKLRLQHSTGFGSTNEFSLPDGASVKDWNIYRITKDASGNVKLYVNENPTPLAEGQTTTTTSNNHFRFGDTNGSHNVSGLIDWIIWDKSGTYAPGQGTPIPSPVVTPSWDATLSDLKADGVLVNGFAADKYDYEITLPIGTTLVPQVTATANHPGANAVITQAPGLPGSATVVVTAQNGVTKTTYTINFTVETTSIFAPEVAGFRFYPNPARSSITFERNDAEVDSRLEILSLTGQMILSKKVNSTNEIIEISHLSPGTYIINITTGQVKSSRLLVKK